MAYMSQEQKAKIAENVKPILKKYGIKGSLAVHHNMTLVLNIKSGIIDFIENYNRVCGNDYVQVSRGFKPDECSGYIQVNPYNFDRHFDGEALKFLEEVYAAMMEGNHNKSDIMTDYFNVGWYVDINIGKWDKFYELIK